MYTGSVEAVLNTADMAILLTASNTYNPFGGQYGGYAHFGPIRVYKQPPTAWAAPIDNDWVFVHELGHIMGAFHNREILHDSVPGRGSNYGFRIRNSNYYTIMAYGNRHYTNNIPYFSMNGQRLGNKYNDNTKQLTEAR